MPIYKYYIINIDRLMNLITPSQNQTAADLVFTQMPDTMQMLGNLLFLLRRLPTSLTKCMIDGSGIQTG